MIFPLGGTTIFHLRPPSRPLEFLGIPLTDKGAAQQIPPSLLRLAAELRSAKPPGPDSDAGAVAASQVEMTLNTKEASKADLP
jgi:hypothetical protein